MVRVPPYVFVCLPMFLQRLFNVYLSCGINNPKDLFKNYLLILLICFLGVFWGECIGGIFVVFCRELGGNVLIELTYTLVTQ